MSAHDIPDTDDPELRDRLAALSEAMSCPQVSWRARSKIREIHAWLAGGGSAPQGVAGALSASADRECTIYPRCSCIVKLDGSWEGCRALAAPGGGKGERG